MMTIEEIQNILIHRYPFLLVDRVLSFDEKNKALSCVKNVTVNEPHFTGHFPEMPIMPGVLLIESMAQAAGLLGYVIETDPVERQGIYLLAGANNVRFRKPVVPGDQVIVTAAFLSQRRNVWRFACDGKVDGKIVCSAEVTCAKKGKLS